MLIIAMVSCGMPLSAFNWANEHLEVLHLGVFRRSLVPLAPKTVVKLDTMFVLRRGG